jgi:predicted DNA-binding transcriptional regulator AlpA
MKLLTKRQVATKLSCHHATIEARVRRGDFPAATLWLGLNSPRWDEVEIDRLLTLIAAAEDPRAATLCVLAERSARLAAA